MSNIPRAYVTIHEHRPLSEKLAIVTASIVPIGGSINSRDERLNLISDALPNGVEPVRGSFTQLDGDTYCGYVANVPEVRIINSKETAKLVTANKLKVLARNIYMDTTDESLWDVKDGVGGQYMVRRGSDDLSSLLETARVSPTGTTTRLAAVAAFEPKVHHAVGFIRGSDGHFDTDYGIVLSSTANAHFVLSASSRSSVKVDRDRIVSSFEVERPKLTDEALKRVKASRAASGKNVTAANMTMTPEEYWKAVFSYDPSYLSDMLKNVSEHNYA